MKKILSILGTISLITSGSSNLMACIKSNNDENGKGNKPEPTPKQEQPPENSNWKLILDVNDEQKNAGKTYIGIFGNKPNIEIIHWKANPAQPKWPLYWFKIVYRWEGKNNPNIPKINKNTGEIWNWNEKMD